MKFINRLKNIGPGALVAAAFIGPGTITVCSSSGASYGYTLLWVILFSTIATIMFQEDVYKRQDKGQMWMYRNNLESMDEDIENGALVDIETRQGRYLGTGFLSKNSHITVRILSKDLNDTFDRKFFKQRIQFAYQFRKTLEADNITNCRLIFGEADQLPGLTVDRYNDILVTQISSYGLEMIKDMIYKLLLEVLSEDGQDVKGIYERNDIKVRSKEGLPLEKGYWKNAQLPTKTVINENGLKLNVDVENGQKTGYFLDQKSNRVLLRNMSHGKRVLDCFSHTGGFALNAAFGNASEVVAVDVSPVSYTHLDVYKRQVYFRNSFIKKL